MKTRIKCTNCGYGNRFYQGTQEIRKIYTNVDKNKLKYVKCPDCGECKLVCITALYKVRFNALYTLLPVVRF